MRDVHADAAVVTKSAPRNGLPAHLPVECRALVLGSMPGDASLLAHAYYAHPRNRFWPVMQGVLQIDAQAPYASRMQALADRGVGLWDVIARCERVGSLDAAIVAASIEVNPFATVLPGLPHLRAVICNGAAAAQAWKRQVQPSLSPGLLNLPLLALPSTSPANAAWSLTRLIEAWQPLRAALD
ncbi:DNA-deoxyinosine glycosylase [Xanthomonas maliensis]|uniref:DNA-deoxyinosine glycosylase n=1 Tax=Xanthomonas maliensis TaxID=1321368 RepID=UPI0004CED28E|nr:DNA-deoxyinosine glycosylase [Xanthomonas maliensis]KAB7765881.1 DNA-deoxyinosine glycosylase [Xanthomonas maliensis]